MKNKSKVLEALRKYSFNSLLVKNFLRVIILMIGIIIIISSLIYNNSISTMKIDSFQSN